MARKTNKIEENKNSENLEINRIFDLLHGAENSEENFAKFDKDIKKEKKNIVSILKKIDKKKLKICDSLIENVAFMCVMLRDLIETIKKKGVKEFYMNGSSQFGYRKRIEVEIYNSMQKNFQTSMKLLIDLLSAEDGLDDEAKEELKKFLTQGRN